MPDPAEQNMTSFSVESMRTKAKCDLFGNNNLIINYQGDMHIPNRWIRFWSKVFFNSKWTLINDNEHNNQKVGM